ncbi:MAG TPA: hypothetical protein DCQ06_05285 [Myxococcales bacterium]|nr:hypothetical protein [Myxococcales bacterium]HAN30991.1 hypothetical protein [Myxococcales bacterium]
MKVCPTLAKKWRAGWRPAAALFDLDGTLVQTEHITKQTLEHMIGRWSSLDTVNINFAYAGRSWFDLANDVVTQTGLDMPLPDVAAKLANYYESIAIDQVMEVHGASHFVHSLRELEIPMAVVTASTRSFTDQAIDKLGLPTLIPPTRCVTDDDVQRSKPHPEGYLKAADLVGLQPRACTVFEDSVPGMRAAQAAGCQVIGVLAHATAPAALQRQAAGWIYDFASLSEIAVTTVSAS